MGVVHVGLVHRDPCQCKVKGFRAVSFIERNVSKRRHLQGVRHTSEVVGGDGTTRAGSTGRGGVSVVSIGTESWSSRIGAGSGTGVEVGSGTDAGSGPRTGVGASCCSRSASDVLAFNPGASIESRVVLRVVGVCRFCNNSVGGRSGKSVKSGTFSSGTGLLRKKRFQLSKRILISTRMVSILVE